MIRLIHPSAAITVALFAWTASTPARIRIETPRDGARPASAYIGIQGTGPAGSAVELLDASKPVRTVRPEADGHFECVLHLSPGRHRIKARLAANGSPFTSIEVTMPANSPAPIRGAPYELLQTADILLSHTPGSEQEELDAARYTHAALYLGPDAEGTPMVAEAVTMERTAAGNPLGALPLERTLIWRGGAAVDIYRLRDPLPFAQRDRIAEWARRRVTEDSAFWSVTEDFGALFRAWLLWDQQRDQPRDKAEFNRTLEKMAALKVSPDRLNCSTLVWQAYWQATKRHIDLSIPNRVTFGGLSGRMSTRFLNRLRPYLVLPDTFALTGKLYKVNGA